MEIKRVLMISAAVVVAAAAAHEMFVVHQREHQKRLELDANAQLDIQAIKDAEKVVREQIDAGEIRSLEQLREVVNTEIKFQKIAIREK